jgi:methyltransferase
MRSAILAVIALLMLAEAWLSARNERRLRASGAVEPRDDVYRGMQLAYPGAFIGMAAEAALRGPAAPALVAAGALTFLGAKALKYWAIASLGPRWTFRVLVPPGAPLVTTGPYRFLRHPNYIAVLGELVGSAVLFASPIAGAAGTLIFAELIRRRIRVENRALRG